MKCADCDLDARWYPVLVMSAPKRLYPNSPSVRAIFGIPTCDDHRVARTVDNLVTDEGFVRIAAGFRAAGRVVPERSSIRVEFSDINSGESRTFRRLQGN